MRLPGLKGSDMSKKSSTGSGDLLCCNESFRVNEERMYSLAYMLERRCKDKTTCRNSKIKRSIVKKEDWNDSTLCLTKFTWSELWCRLLNARVLIEPQARYLSFLARPIIDLRRWLPLWKMKWSRLHE